MGYGRFGKPWRDDLPLDHDTLDPTDRQLIPASHSAWGRGRWTLLFGVAAL